ncbi:MAG: hypothetical protein DRQ49_19500, partial [Gammaproteobacteria bacterium]
MLWHYYGLEFTEQFAQLFGNYYIGEHPTPEANSYAVLYLEFSRIDTTTRESTFEGFLSNVRWAVKDFLNRYTQLKLSEQKSILSCSSPSEVLKALFETVDKQQPIYVII